MLFLNNVVFHWLNAPAGAPVALVQLAIAIATWLVAVVPTLLVALWIWGHPHKRAALIATGLAASAALACNQLLGALWYEPRPFMAHIGRSLMAHAADNSFPSDHATFMATVAIGLIATRGGPRWGVALLVAAITVAWARIYLGVHFPIDMVASLGVAIVFGASSVLLVAPIRCLAMPIIEPIYDSVSLWLMQALSIPSPHRQTRPFKENQSDKI